MFPIGCVGSVLSFLVLQSSCRGKESWLLCFYCLTDACYSKCTVALPHGAVGWSGLCDCGISVTVV